MHSILFHIIHSILLHKTCTAYIILHNMHSIYYQGRRNLWGKKAIAFLPFLAGGGGGGKGDKGALLQKYNITKSKYFKKRRTATGYEKGWCEVTIAPLCTWKWFKWGWPAISYAGTMGTRGEAVPGLFRNGQGAAVPFLSKSLKKSNII